MLVLLFLMVIQLPVSPALFCSSLHWEDFLNIYFCAFGCEALVEALSTSLLRFQSRVRWRSSYLLPRSTHFSPAICHDVYHFILCSQGMLSAFEIFCTVWAMMVAAPTSREPLHVE